MDHDEGWGYRPGTSFRIKNPRRWTGRLLGIVHAGVLSLCLWGCGSVEQAPETSEPKPPPPDATASMMSPEMGSPMEELKKYMTPERTQFAAGAGGVLFATFIFGVLVGRARKSPSAS